MSNGIIDRAGKRWPGFGWSALAVFGLLLALAAGMNAAGAPLAGPGPARLSLGLPMWLKLTVLGSLAAAFFGFLFFIFPPRRPRRRKGEEEFQIVHEAPKLSPWVLVVLVAIALIPVTLAGAFLWWGWPDLGSDGISALRLPGARPPVAPVPGMAGTPPTIYQPLFTGAVAFLGLAVAVACVAMALWLAFGDRVLGGWVPPTRVPPVPPGLAEAVDESLESLRQDPDARRAIIRCYRRFEGVLTGIGFPRAPWETPAEFMRTALALLPVPPAALSTLTTLFELSRFSQHPVGPAERDTAVTSLTEIKAAIDRREPRASRA
jgi:hypothetical protein